MDYPSTSGDSSSSPTKQTDGSSSVPKKGGPSFRLIPLSKLKNLMPKSPSEISTADVNEQIPRGTYRSKQARFNLSLENLQSGRPKRRKVQRFQETLRQ